MAELSIEKATLRDGTLTVTGSGFTKTTTEVKIGGEVVDFTVDGDRTLTVENVDVSAKRVRIKRGDVTKTKDITDDYQDAVEEPQDEPDYGDTDQSTTGKGKEPYKTAKPDSTPGDLTDDDAATTSDVSEEDLSTSANQGSETIGQGSDVMRKAMEPDRADPKPGEHVPAQDASFRVENTAAGDLNMDPREPYPTGNPPDPREEFYRVHGYYPENEDLKKARREA